jgi:hypothetical protein
VDRLELVMEQGRLHEWREPRLLVDEALEVGEQVGQLVGRRRNERCRLDRRTLPNSVSA